MTRDYEINLSLCSGFLGIIWDGMGQDINGIRIVYESNSRSNIIV